MRAWSISNENGFFFHSSPVRSFIILLFQSSGVFLAFHCFKRMLFTYFPPHWKCRFGFLLSGWSQYLSERSLDSKQQNIWSRNEGGKLENEKVLQISSFNVMKCVASCWCLGGWAEAKLTPLSSPNIAQSHSPLAFSFTSIVVCVTIQFHLYKAQGNG